MNGERDFTGLPYPLKIYTIELTGKHEPIKSRDSWVIRCIADNFDGAVTFANNLLTRNSEWELKLIRYKGDAYLQPREENG